MLRYVSVCYSMLGYGFTQFVQDIITGVVKTKLLNYTPALVQPERGGGGCEGWLDSSRRLSERLRID